MGEERRKRRGDGGDADGDAHRHRQDVIDEQGRRGGQSGPLSQVLLGDDVGPSPGRVGVNRLPIRDGDDDQQAGDARRDGKSVAQGREATGREREQNLVGRVGHRRKGVGGEDGQGDGFGDPLMDDLGGRQGIPQENPLEGESALRGAGLPVPVHDLDGDVLGHAVGEPSKKKGHGRKPVALSAALILVKNPPRRQTVPAG